ncbi:hypothetical protein [Dechloromonas sp.]|uniref:hypothetical protein n=1 Tax=Dechloromonas sp. TaxID=1917218 RepID=UPI0011F6279A|nr:hypothetical protein [Dechloromonas sp.]MBU3696918.1 hypothetical protein [Dechloromonas sp.]TEX49299.1 MAG: hypothetical protein CFR70_03685 [Rhodocyclaceae bacterium]
MMLDQFLALPFGERRDHFEELTVADQRLFLQEHVDPVELIFVGYPSESSLSVDRSADRPTAKIIAFPMGGNASSGKSQDEGE